MTDLTLKVVPGTLFKVGCSLSLFQSVYVRVLGVVWGGKTKIQNSSNFGMGVQGAIPDLTNFDIGLDGPILIYSSCFSRELYDGGNEVDSIRKRNLTLVI